VIARGLLGFKKRQADIAMKANIIKASPKPAPKAFP